MQMHQGKRFIHQEDIFPIVIDGGEKGAAIEDIGRFGGTTHVFVLEMLKELKRRGFVRSEALVFPGGRWFSLVEAV